MYVFTIGGWGFGSSMYIILGGRGLGFGNSVYIPGVGIVSV